MKKVVAIFVTVVVLSISAPSQASPSSGYSDFLKSLDSITAGAAIPVADDQFTLAPSGFAGGVTGLARNLLGSRVVWGGASPSQGFDCSGLVQYVFRQAGVDLPRTADIQFLVGAAVPRTALRPGDLVYFTTYAPGASHVGIYIGLDKFIHTSFSQGVVAVGDMNDDYFARRYYGAKRVL
jgi:cell wall-associated NlpC family hydrolase